MHYQRWRRGSADVDVPGPIKFDGLTLQQRVEQNAVWEGDCLVWRTSYGQRARLNVNGVLMSASVAVWEEAHGAVQHQVLHACYNHLCVNIEHLYDGTPEQNMRDRVLAGTHPQAKLTPDDVRAIRAASGSHASLARKYGVSPAAIARVRLGRSWGWLD
jgi:hypothetical protein